jgi:hypothetical protein
MPNSLISGMKWLRVLPHASLLYSLLEYFISRRVLPREFASLLFINLFYFQFTTFYLHCIYTGTKRPACDHDQRHEVARAQARVLPHARVRAAALALPRRVHEAQLGRAGGDHGHLREDAAARGDRARRDRGFGLVHQRGMTSFLPCVIIHIINVILSVGSSIFFYYTSLCRTLQLSA